MSYGEDTTVRTMNTTTLLSSGAIFLGSIAMTAASLSAQSAIGWGDNLSGQIDVPAGLGTLRMIDCGSNHTVAIVDSTGAVVCWGSNSRGQSTVPAGVAAAESVAGGAEHSVCVRPDGSVVCWGDNFYGQRTVPAGVSNAMQAAAGAYFSGALRSDGSITLWGRNNFGQRTVPTGLSRVIKLELGGEHGLALRDDGSVVAWGRALESQTSVPAALGAAMDLAAGDTHSVALRFSDNAVFCWGSNDEGQSTVPAGLTQVVAVAAGVQHTLALRYDGSVVAWGRNLEGQCDVPTTLGGAFDASAGQSHSVAAQRASGVDDPVITVDSSTPQLCTDGTGAISVTLANVDTFYWTGPSGFFTIAEDIAGLSVGTYVAHARGPGGETTATVSIGTDTTAPVIAAYNQLITAPVAADCTAIMPDFTTFVVASDNCGVASITQSPLQGVKRPLGTTAVTITVADASGNSRTLNATFVATGQIYSYFVDADSDTFGKLPASSCSPTPPIGTVLVGGDCNDASNAVYPGAPELCGNSTVDNDCDGNATEINADAADKVDYYRDADDDTFTTTATQKFCPTTVNPGWRPAQSAVTDCDDTQFLYRDGDNDGFGAGAPVACGVANSTDCDDASNATYPGAPELCANGTVDNDCDGNATEIDADAADEVDYYQDQDNDTFTIATTERFCPGTVNPGWRPAQSAVTDCDDTQFLYHDGDSDTYGAGAPVACGVANSTDCDDASNATYPGAPELCGNSTVDNDCDGNATEINADAADKVDYYQDQDNDTFTTAETDRFCPGTVNPGWRPAQSSPLDCNDDQLQYRDGDNDGFGAGAPVACGVANSTDCDDGDSTVYPGAPELCANGTVDNDCDGNATEIDAEAADKVFYYRDQDNDTFTIATTERFCPGTVNPGWRPAQSAVADCDDTQFLYRDGDSDTYGSGDPAACGVANSTDCDDGDSTVYPGAPELCANGTVDNDCDGNATEINGDAADKVDYYRDADDDTFTTVETQKFCPSTVNPGWRPAPSSPLDCDDSRFLYIDVDSDGFGGDILVACGVANTLDCNDNQLQYRDGDDDGFGAGAPVACGVTTDSDCADNDLTRFPGAPERCENDGVDNDCDGINTPDESTDVLKWYPDGDTDGFGRTGGDFTFSCSPVSGRVPNALDCDDGDSSAYPGAPELCVNSTADNDCDGNATEIDDNAADKVFYYRDQDNDTFTIATTESFCPGTVNPGWRPAQSAVTDCDDASNATYPGAPELCANGTVDNDCDGNATEINAGAADKVDYYQDQDNDTFTTVETSRFCPGTVNPGWRPAQSSPLDCNDSDSTSYPLAPELCANGTVDNDCDGNATEINADAADKVDYYRDADDDTFTTTATQKFCPTTVNPGWRPAQSAVTDCDDTQFLYRDGDNDGFGAGAPVACGVANSTDCDDASNATYPGAPELCANGTVDNDCDGNATEINADAADEVDYYQDQDNDTFTIATTERFCPGTVNPGWRPAQSAVTDCDDTQFLYRDGDSDTYGAGAPVACGVANSTDCDDASNATYPGASELCGNSTVDNDCDGNATEIDADAADKVDYYQDQDNDTFTTAETDRFCPGTVNPGWRPAQSSPLDCNDDQLQYRDGDNDGFGAGAPVACGVANSTDCDDGDSTVYPGAPELCGNSTVDNDCDGNATEINGDAADKVDYFRDQDNDTFTIATTERFCPGTVNPGWRPAQSAVADCNDTQFLYRDGDSDTYGSGDPAACGVANSTDCDDGDSTVYPGAPELCANGTVDNDCDGNATEINGDAADKVDYFRDQDNDTFTIATTERFCPGTVNPGWRPVQSPVLDCDDTQFLYRDGDSDGFGAGAAAACGVPTNNDCDDARPLYFDGDGDGFGVEKIVACGSQYNTDCDDASNATYPGAPELCGNSTVDNDCDGNATEIDADAADKVDYYQDQDNDTFTTAETDRFCPGTVNPGWRPAQSSPLDCNDDQLQYRDGDNDGFGAGAPVACGVPTSTDCDDASNATYPGAPELCANGTVDNDCDGNATEIDADAADKVFYYRDQDNDTFTIVITERFCPGTVNPGWRPAQSAVTDCDDTQFLYRDGDSDTYGAGDPAACGVASSTDCDDGDSTVYPGAPELCGNGTVDNDCDGNATEIHADAADKVDYYRDQDHDTFTIATTARFCPSTVNSGWRPAQSAVTDCDDTQFLYRDGDNDGFGAGAPVACGVPTSTDCDDASNATYPGAPELCANGTVDNDCDGNATEIDADAADEVDYFRDADDDTFTTTATQKFCPGTVNPGWRPAQSAVTDCDDTQFLYRDGDSDTYGAGDPAACGVASSTDCDDGDSTVYPGAPELCGNGTVDNDCDGNATEIHADAADKVDYYRDQDDDTFTTAETARFCPGTLTPGWRPAPSSPLDCNDYVLQYRDGDNDGFGAGAPVACGVPTNTDCNDSSPDVNPGATEICDIGDTDENCSGASDDADPSTAEASKSVFYLDADLDGAGDCAAQVRACDVALGRTPTCGDGCPDDAGKTVPGLCGCGSPDDDSDGDGRIDCTDIALELFQQTDPIEAEGFYSVRVSGTTLQEIIPMTGMQVGVVFDSSRLTLDGGFIEPVAGGPFGLEVARLVDERAGTLLYALGTNQSQPGMTGSTALFDIHFRVKAGADLCAQQVELVRLDLVDGVGPDFVSPRFVDRAFTASLPAPETIDLDRVAPVLTGVPESIELPADAGRTDGAFVAEPTVTASDNCTDSPAVMLLITYPNGVSANAWPASGMFPTGTTSLRWTTVDDTGNDVAADRSITVLPYQLLDFTIRMDCPQSAVASHAIRFQAAGATRVATLDFPAWKSGTPQFATGSIQLPVAAGYGCVEAKDIAATVDGVAYFSHAVTDTASPVVIGRRYAASFVLVEGDSNNDDNIDIQDFSLFVFDRSSASNPTTTPEGRSNFNADAFVETADFSVINVNFFKRGQTCAAGVAGPAPLARISVKELRRRGEGHLAIADLNGDGWVDASDVALFMQQGAASGAVDGRPGRVERPAAARW